MKIRHKLPLVMLPVASLGALLMIVFSQRAVRQVLIQGVIKSGNSITLDLAQKPETVVSYQSGDERLLLPVLQQAKELSGALYAMALDPQGRVLAHTNVAEKGKLYTDDATLAAIRSEQPENSQVEVEGQPVMDFSFPVWELEKAEGGEEFLLLGKREVRVSQRLGTVRLGLPLGETLALADRVSAEVVLIVWLVTPLAVVALLLTMGRFLRPIHLLGEAAEKVGRGEVGITVPVVSSDEIGDLARSFNRMSQDLATTTVSRDFLDRILRNVQDILVVTDATGAIQLLSHRTLELLGYAEEGMMGHPVKLLFPPEAELVTTGWLQQSGSRQVVGREVELLASNGERVSVILSMASYRGPGEESGIILTATDISARKQAEEQLRISLQEKEVLLKEIHHRVKNNLQVISSLLDLQSAQIADDRTLAMFRDSQNRVRSMALIHERLYRSEDLARIDFAEYIENLVRGLFKSYQTSVQKVRLRLEIDQVRLGVDQAIPCGLIINELVSNAFKHAFPGGRAGELLVSFRRRGEAVYALRIKDDGVGFPEGVDFGNSSSLGLKLVNLLVKQVKGRIALRREQGTEFEVELPLV